MLIVVPIMNVINTYHVLPLNYSIIVFLHNDTSHSIHGTFSETIVLNNNAKLIKLKINLNLTNYIKILSVCKQQTTVKIR